MAVTFKSKPKWMTPKRVERLTLLAQYLQALPKSYQHFDMSSFVGSEKDLGAKYFKAMDGSAVRTCGTTACAVGHGPAAGIAVPPSMLTIKWQFWGTSIDVNWHGYATLFVGQHHGLTADPEAKRRWEWVFGGDWSNKDNHHYGAAARIRYLLDHGEPPREFDPKKTRTFKRALYADYRVNQAEPLPRDHPANMIGVPSRV